MGIKELVNAFNLNNYACDKISTNFTVEGKKIVGLFAGDTNIGEYLRRMEKEIIGRHYGTREIANEYYNLDCFPFVSGANHDEEYLGNGIVKVKLADSTDPAVIHNLKVHFASEFKRAVRSKVAACLQKEVGISEEEAYEWVNETVGTGAIGKPYLYCIAFSNEYLKREYDLETFEFFKQAYIKEFNSRLENCGLKSSNFYEYKDDVLYIKDVSDKVVRSVAEYVKGRVALYLGTPGTEDSKVENFKDVLGDFIFKLTGKSINAYEYDVFTDKKKIENGNDFVLIPLTKRYSGQLESLKHKDVYRINIKYKNLMSDIRGKTANPQFANCKEPVYAFSNKQIALLLPKIMESPIAYNQISGRFEFAVDLENFKECGSSRSSSTVASPFNSPTHAEPSGLRTPPEQTGDRFKGDRDSGIGESPLRPEGSVAHSSSGGPGPSTALSYTELESPTGGHGEELKRPPRRGLLYCHVNPDGTSEGFSPQNVSAGFNLRPQSRPSSWKGANESGSAWTSQPIDSWPLPAPSAEPSLWQPSRPLSRKGANESGSAWTSQPIDSWPLPASSAELRQQSQVSSSGPSSSRGADESVRTEKSIWYVLSSYSPGVEDVNDVEHEKQQVTDDNHNKCSEAKPQESKSPKERGGGIQKIKKLLFSPFKKQYGVNLERHDVGRDTTRSMPTIPVTNKPPLSERSASERDVGRDTTRSMPTIPVTNKPPLSERSASERKAKSNPPSKVTSPVHSPNNPGLPLQGTTVVESNSGLKSQKRLDHDQRKELRPLLSPEQQRKLDSNSFLPGEEQHLYLTHTPSGKRELSRSLCEGEQSQLSRLAEAQLSSPDNLSSEKGNRDSGYSSGFSASPAVPHKESVSSKVEECSAQHMLEALKK